MSALVPLEDDDTCPVCADAGWHLVHRSPGGRGVTLLSVEPCPRPGCQVSGQPVELRCPLTTGGAEKRQVQGSGGATYTLTRRAAGWACTCAGFTFHVSSGDVRDDAVNLRLRQVDGRPVLVGLDAVSLAGAPRELTASELHGLPLDELTSAAVRAVGSAVADATPFPYRRDPSREGTAAVAARRRRALTDALLDEVERVASANPEAPTRAVSEQMFCSYRTAGRWMAEARARRTRADNEKERGK